MPNKQLQPGQSVAFYVGGLAADETTFLPLGSATATIDDYTHGFIGSINPGAVPGAQAWGAVVYRGGVPEGTTATVNVTIQSTSQDGTVLPVQTFQLDFLAGPPPAQAVSCNVGLSDPSTQWSNAVDPGSPTLTLI